MGLKEYDEKSLSKYLCFLLRHKPEHAKLDMDKHGWVPVEQLITNVNLYSKYCLDNYLLEKIVAEDDKGSYVFDDTYRRRSESLCFYSFFRLKWNGWIPFIRLQFSYIFKIYLTSEMYTDII